MSAAVDFQSEVAEFRALLVRTAAEHGFRYEPAEYLDHISEVSVRAALASSSLPADDPERIAAMREFDAIRDPRNMRLLVAVWP